MLLAEKKLKLNACAIENFHVGIKIAFEDKPFHARVGSNRHKKNGTWFFKRLSVRQNNNVRWNRGQSFSMIVQIVWTN